MEKMDHSTMDNGKMIKDLEVEDIMSKKEIIMMVNG